MGLDMYLFRTKRLPGFKTQDYLDLDDKIYGSKTLEEAKASVGPEHQDLVAQRGENYTWFSIFEEVAYWRKVNSVHRWFVDNVQSGVDECQYAEVIETQLKELLVQVRIVLQEPRVAERLLPTRSGFFFGTYEYDGWYWEGMKTTETQVARVLAETDWDKQIVFYHSSW
jgi:hypothetical protein